MPLVFISLYPAFLANSNSYINHLMVINSPLTRHTTQFQNIPIYFALRSRFQRSIPFNYTLISNSSLAFDELSPLNTIYPIVNLLLYPFRRNFGNEKTDGEENKDHIGGWTSTICRRSKGLFHLRKTKLNK